MINESSLNIIKGAILLERKGKAFYERTAANTKSNAVKEIFETMAAEEERHIQILKKHFEQLTQSGKFQPIVYESAPVEFSKEVLTAEVREDISASDYEAAAISAAMAMEEKAVQFYSARAKVAEVKVERELFEWLAKWEKTHLQFLADIDKALTEEIWYDNKFWPMG